MKNDNSQAGIFVVVWIAIVIAVIWAHNNVTLEPWNTDRDCPDAGFF
jgi:hypothetical protein